MIWKYENPTPIHLVSFSSDEKYFATVSRFDRLVKVWYRNRPALKAPSTTPVISISDAPTESEEDAETFSYIYLPHPRSVTSISWRFKDIQSQQGDEFSANVLLTTSIDNVIRVWSETNENEELSFYVCTIIERDTSSNVQWLNTAHEKSPNEAVLHYLRTKRKKYYEGDHKEFVTDFEQKATLDSRMLSASSDTGLFESQTWLGTVQSDGTLMIDLIQGLADFPRRTPKTSMWIRMSNALKGFKDPLNVSMFYKTADDSNADIGTTMPKILTIYVQSRNGMLSSWELNLSKGSRPQLELFNIFTGHRGPVDNIACHPSLPLVASFDSHNKHLIAWHARDTPYYCPKDILTNIQDFEIDTSNISWYPTLPYLFCSTNRGIEVIQIKASNPLAHNLSSIYESTIYPPLPSYYDIQSANFKLTDSEGFGKALFMKVVPVGTVPTEKEKVSTIGAFIVAINSNGTSIGVWKVEENKATEGSTSSIFTSTLILKESIEGSPVTCADCERIVPFIPEMHKSEAALASESSIKNYFSKQALVLTVGRSNGTATIFRIRKKEKEETPKQAPKPMIGGIMGKFLTTSSTSNASKTTSSSNEEEKIGLEQWFDFKAEDSAVKLIKCCDLLSRVVTTSEGSNTVRIWECESHTNFSLEQAIEVKTDEFVTDCSWHHYGDGQHILTIGSNKQIYCFTQSKVSSSLLVQKEQYWKKVTDFMPSVKGAPCSKISVTKEQTVVASFGSSLHVYTKFLQDEDATKIGSRFNLSGTPSLMVQTMLMHRRLSDYHPNFLLELLMDGRFNIVRKIIMHLVKHLIIFNEKVEKKRNDKFDSYMNKDSDYAYLLVVPSIKLTSLMKEEEVKKVEPVPQKRRTLLDKFTVIDETPKTEEATEKKEETNTEETEMNIFEAVRIIKTSLTSVHLPGLTSMDQMNLIAVIDTYVELHKNPEALDVAGIRFLVVVKFMQYLAKKQQHNSSMKMTQTNDLLLNKVKSSLISWALISETQDSLWNMVCPEEVNITWTLLQQLGCVYWQTNPNSLRKTAERLAKQIFKDTADPSKCALYYLAMKKKGALAQLFKLKGNEKVAEFINKDFTDDKNKTSAMKNAFVLMSRQDFNYAAAYFLLAESPKDAIDILIKKTRQYDLAYFVTRLYCGDDSDFCKKLLQNEILPYYKNEERDTWMQSAIQWISKDYEKSVETLVSRRGVEESETFDPSLFSYCVKIDSKPHLNASDVISKHVLPIILRTTHYYFQAGLYTFCLEYLLKMKNIDQYTSKKKLNTSSGQSLMSGQINMGSFGGGMGGMGGSMLSGNLSSGTFGGMGGMSSGMNSGNLSSGTFGGMGMSGMSSGNLSSGTLSGGFGMGGFGGMGGMGNMASGTLSGGFGGMGMGGMNSGNLSSGTLSGGFGMGGFGGMGNPSPTTKNQTPKVEEEAKEQTDITDLVRFKTALNILCQELYDISNQTYHNYGSDWDKNHNKIMTDIDEIVSKFGMDKCILIKKLKQFTKLNGFLTARCLLCKDGESILGVLEAFAYQIETTLSSIVKSPLKESQVANIDSLLQDFVYCYNRMRTCQVKISEKQQADLSSTLLVSIFSV